MLAVYGRSLVRDRGRGKNYFNAILEKIKLQIFLPNILIFYDPII